MNTKRCHSYVALPFNTPAMLSTDALAELFPGTTPATWHKLRANGRGPAATKVAGRLYYPRTEVEDWLNNRAYPA